MIESDKIDIILNSINKLRTNPKSCIKEFELISKAFERAGKSEESKELIEFSKTLSVLEPVHSLTLSKDLSSLAKEKIKIIVKGLKEDEEEYFDRLNKHIKGYSEYDEIYEDGSEPSSIIARLIISENDKDKKNKSILINSSFTFIGIGFSNKDENICVLSFSDSLIEKDNIPLSDQILMGINRLRLNPSKIKAFGSKILIFNSDNSQVGQGFTNRKESISYANELKSYIDSIGNSSIPELVRHEELDELCVFLYEKYINNKINDISNEKTIQGYAETSIHGFEKVYFYISPPGIKASTQVILSLIGNKYEKNMDIQSNGRKIGFDQSVRHIGIDVVGLYEKNTRVIFIGVDNFTVGSLKEHHLYMTDELNRFRENPSSYISDLVGWKVQLDGKTYKSEILNDVNSYMNDLKNKKKMGRLENSQLLNKACEDYIFIIENGYEYSEDDDLLSIRLDGYISKKSKVKSFVRKGNSRPESFITELLVSEKDRTKQSRFALEDEDYKYYGIVKKTINNENYLVMILSDSVEEREFVSVEENILYNINLIRKYPRSVIRNISINIKDMENEVKTGNKKKGSNQVLNQKIEFGYKIISFLLHNSKISSQVERITELDDVARIRLSENINKGEEYSYDYTDSYIKNSDLQENINEFLRKYISNFNKIYEVYGNFDFTSIKDFDFTSLLSKILINSLDMSFMERLFFFNMKKIGISTDSSTKPKSFFQIFLFDHAIPIPNIKIPVRLRQNLSRPCLTKDELDQIRFDFKKIDILENGHIKPNVIMSFIANNFVFTNNNPLYYEAIRRINTMENNENGVNVNVLIDSITEIIGNMKEKEFETLFNVYLKFTGELKFNFNSFLSVVRRLGYEHSDSEIRDIFEKLVGEKDILEKEDFVEMMMATNKVKAI